MKGPIAAGLLALGPVAYAQTSQRCQNSICYALNIPGSTASSGTGDIYFQITAPTSYQWVALGQGTGMKGANIFVMYTSSSGSNVTVSPRLGKGHFEPEHNPDAQISLLEGSGVSGDTMTANVRCSSCNSWTGGSQSFSDTAGKWIYAYKSGSAINSDSTSAEIVEHDVHGTGLSFDFSAAQGGSSTNPFVTTSKSTGSTGSSGTTTSSNTTTVTEGGFGSEVSQTQLLMAHGILAALVWVILFPMGAIVIRLLSFPGLVMLHVAIQLVAYILFITAFGLGIYIARTNDLLDEYHPIIGIIIFSLVTLQPILGFLHHKQYKIHQRRTLFSHAHIWLGRLVITLGIINGGLGLMLADNTTAGYIAYGIVAGIVWLAYVVAAIVGERRKSRAPTEPPKYEHSAMKATA